MKAKNLSEYNTAKKLTNKQLAEHSRISETYPSRSRPASAPGKELALKIAEITGIPVLKHVPYPQAEVSPMTLAPHGQEEKCLARLRLGRTGPYELAAAP